MQDRKNKDASSVDVKTMSEVWNRQFYVIIYRFVQMSRSREKKKFYKIRSRRRDVKFP